MADRGDREKKKAAKKKRLEIRYCGLQKNKSIIGWKKRGGE